MEHGPRERRPDGDPPFGLPVLAEVPELAALLELAVAAERLTARLVEAIVVAEDHDVAPATTGVALEQWLAVVARSTRSDRRMLVTAARVCRRLPSLRAAFAEGRVSWSQVRAVALKVERLPRHLDDRIDAAVADAVAGAADVDPDALARVVSWVLADVDRGDGRGRGVPDHDVLVLQPRLDGSGGTIWGDLGPVGFAAIDAATDPGPVGIATRDQVGAAPDPVRATANRVAAGRARAARLVDLCRRDGDGELVPPRLLVRAELTSLLGADGQPGQLLTSLAGGVMHVDAATARRLVDVDGADVRLIVLDDGAVVGVGRSRRHPPGWLTDATLAVHDTCSEPGCQVAARVCDTDHARPWNAGGATDLANLAPLCATANRRKETDGWQVTQTRDGARTWHHPRTGLTTRTLPATWRPPPRPDRRGPPVRGRTVVPSRRDGPPHHTSRSRLERCLHAVLTAHADDQHEADAGGTDLPF